MRIEVNKYQTEEIEGLTAEYPYVYHDACFKSNKVPWHWHEELEFDYVKKGSVKISTLNDTFLVQENEAFFINTNLLCTMENAAPDNLLCMDSHLFHSTLLGGSFRSIFSTKYMTPILQNKNLSLLIISGNTTRQKEMLKHLRRLAKMQKEYNAEFITRNILSDLWLLLLEEVTSLETDSPSINTPTQERIQTMLSYIHKNFDRKITLLDIAASANISKRECLRTFKKAIQMSPVDYLIEHRIECAKKLLQETDLSITQITLEVGFDSASYFGKTFKRLCGVSPREYRNSVKEVS